MAKGWESKSVEEQASVHAEEAAEKKAKPVRDAAVMRQRNELELQRERILDERTSNPHRRAALEAALAEIEGRLTKLNGD